MSDTEDREPRPRPNAQSVARFSFPAEGRTALPQVCVEASAKFFDVVKRRRSGRAFGPLEMFDLGALLGYTHGRVEAGRDAATERRMVPSAGALHACSIVVLTPSRQQPAVYDAAKHDLVGMPAPAGWADSVYRAIAPVIERGEGTVILLVADIRFIRARYIRSDSLIWRDAGVIIGHMGLVSTALDLAFLPLGLTGQSHISSLLRQPETVIRGVGMAIVGSRRPTSECG